MTATAGLLARNLYISLRDWSVGETDEKKVFEERRKNIFSVQIVAWKQEQRLELWAAVT